MSIRSTAIRTAAALVAASAPAIALAQPGAAPERPVSVELQALNPPVPDDLVLAEERRVPAERKAAGYNDADWAVPRTSWGHPSLEGTWSTDDMRAIPFDRAEALGAQEFLDPEQFVERARRQQAGSDHAANIETFHRNSWGTRSFGFSSLVVDPPNGRTPALTADGRARAAAAAGRGSFGPGPFDTFEDFSLYDRCIARGLAAGMGAVLYGNALVIVQSPDAVTITYEMIHETRVIALADRPHLADGIVQYTGNSRGRWDGDTLVVETNNLRGAEDGPYDGWLDVNGSPYSQQAKFTERFRRPAFGHLQIDTTVEDPKGYTSAWTVRIDQRLLPDQEMIEFVCNENQQFRERIKID
jgi:hypothetical protein